MKFGTSLLKNPKTGDTITVRVEDLGINLLISVTPSYKGAATKKYVLSLEEVY